MTTIEDIRLMAGEAKDLAAQGEQEQAIDLLAEGLEAVVEEVVSINTRLAKLETKSADYITQAGLEAAFSNYQTEREIEETL